MLYIVSTPIGNYADITLRALRILNESEYIICEEYKPASRLLNYFGFKKNLTALNEHTEKEITEEIFLDLALGKQLALISDGGTPAFEDPGSLLINKCIDANIKIDFIPGANSVMTAVVTSGFDISRFYFLGFLSPKREIRHKEINGLKSLNRTAVLLEAPYRLQTLLKDFEEIMPDRKIYIGFDLTMKTEKHFRGTAGEILSKLGEPVRTGGEKIKGEFVILIDKK
jgi:16S rRNA (cytidine1402-2'-O)-methyltransferase